MAWGRVEKEKRTHEMVLAGGILVQGRERAQIIG
jgi:hypothetical protein